MAAVRRLEAGVKMPVLPGRNSKRRFRVDSGVKRANTPTKEGWRRKAGTKPSKIVCNRRSRQTRPPPRRRNGGGIKRSARRRAQSIDPVTAAVFSRMRRNAEPRPKMLGLGRI